jgi:ribosome-dependent ATPase
LFPMSYFVPISVGTFTKGLGFSDLGPDLAALAVFVPVLLGLNCLLLRKQAR